MPLTTNTQTVFAFKNLLNKSNTDVTKGLNNEAEGIFQNLPGESIWIEQISSTPATAVSAGVAVAVTADMILDGTSNGHALFATWPATPPAGTDPRTGLAFAYGTGTLMNISPGSRVQNAISPTFGVGYIAKPYFGASPIPVGDQRDWVYQYNSGIFFQEDGSEQAWGGSSFGHPTTIQLYVYIGDTVLDITSGGVTGTGTTNKMTKWTDGPGGTVGDSSITDNGSAVGVGSDVSLNRSGELVQANGAFNTAGDAQVSTMVARLITTDDTPSEMSLDDLSPLGQISVATDTVCGFVIHIAAVDTATGDAKFWNYVGGIKNVAGTTSTFGSVTKNVYAADSGASLWDTSVTADDTDDRLVITATGAIATTIRWVAKIEFTEIGF